MVNACVHTLPHTLDVCFVIYKTEMRIELESWCGPFTVCCSVLRCAAVCCSVLQCVAMCWSLGVVHLQYAAVCCSVLQCVAVCCSALQCVAVCWSSGVVDVCAHTLSHAISPLNYCESNSI